jgi:stage V sporulation protein B
MSEAVQPVADKAPVADAGEGRAAGRGALFIGVAKIYFMFAGAVIDGLLPRLLGDAGYGAYRFVNSWVSVVNNVVVTGTIQSVSRETVARPADADAVKATGFKMHLLVGVPLALLFAAATPLIATFSKDWSILPPLLVAAAIIAGYAFYAVLVGAANGQKQFHKQAALDMSFATLRAALLIGVALLTAGNLTFVFGGWVVAVAMIIVLALVMVGGPRGARATSVRPMLAFMGAMVAYQVVSSLLTATDTLLLKPLATDHFLAQGQTAAQAAIEANRQVGWYGNVQLIARLPWQLMLAVTFVVFPLMSGATLADDRERARTYVRTTMRYSLVLAGLMGVALAGGGGPLLRIISPEHPGGWALPVLTLGHVAFALFSIGGTILNASGRSKDAILAGVVTLVALGTSLWLVLPRLEPGAELLLGAASCTAGAMGLGMLLTGGLLLRRFGEFLPVLTVVRTALALAAGLTVVRFVPGQGLIGFVVDAAAAGAAYLVVLFVTLELGKADLARLTSLVKRRKKTP